MTRSTSVAFGALALALCLVSNPAHATSTSGWSQADRSAAKIRELQTRLMVAALRCRAAGVDILASYNQFVGAERDELRAANDQLKAHFAVAGSVLGQRDYDRYTTALANSYGATSWGPRSCDQAASLASEAVQAKGNLMAVADRQDELASESSAQSPSRAADDRPSSQAYDDRGRYGQGWPRDDRDDRPGPQAYRDQGPPPGYFDRDPSPRYRDEPSYSQAYDDRGPPPGYDDQGPSRSYGDGRPSPQAYNDQAPPPGYGGWGPPPGYDDRAPPPGYDDRAPPPGYGGD